ncbi:DNA-formamidopyrimidine glycosylase family protein [Microlunatus sp. Gsoil 973]|uniref:DNA-formamidopyrimidine glycosylase family protein n=1 Tax=Microlunatus sp. Gsoil 973 TaxID=2672569 RepID=UPI0012B46CC3|nr:DNA-formamidopyrimidine glycosylase family protein [Microlunatus sp. Gsoil 973]QGN34693.1 DNA glycosylase [Microlunatus sp. Gsoil 973]
MPEGDTVWRAAHLLHRALAGNSLTRCEFRVPALATTDLTGRIVTEAVSRGKHLLIRFDNGWSLHSHLRMEGSWRIFADGRRWNGGPSHEIRAVLGVPGSTAVGYRLGVLELVRTDQESAVVGHLGPDLLGPEWDLAEAVRRLRAEPDRAIGEALLDQRNLAGIGTVYRAEILFLQGIHPRTPVGQVRDLERLCERVRQLLIMNRSGFEQNTTGDRRPGRSHWVYGRAGRECRRCGTAIAMEEFGPYGQERVSYWCPHCQPLRPG